MIALWASSNYAGRRSHDKPPSESGQNSRSSSPDGDTRLSSSSEATPRPTPAPHPQHLASATSHDLNANMLGNTSASDFGSSSRRLGFFTDKLSTSQTSQSLTLSGSGHTAGQRSVLPGILHPHNHLRAESALGMASTSSSSATNMSSLSSPSNSSKLHSTPSKPSPGRTYDSKLVSREMHRLGTLGHLPATLAPPLAATTSANSLPGPSSGLGANMATAPTGDNPWGSLHVHLLPLFNGEPLRIPIEDLNLLVKRHIQTIVSQSLAKALSTLESDASELIASGMVTLNAKLVGLEDDKLLGRVVEIWGFFWDQVLPYVEGALLPLQTDSLILSLYRTPKTRRNSSPPRHNLKGSSSLNSNSQTSAYYIDVRTLALRSFRDRIILPLFPRLCGLLSMPNRQDNYSETAGYQEPRLQQMLLVLASQSRTRPPSFSLTAPAPQPSSGEAAISELLRILRAPMAQQQRQNSKLSNGQFPILAHAPSFLSGGLPRDRRGRVAQKQKEMEGRNKGDAGDPFVDGDETPRKGFGTLTLDLEREREFLEALRSPDVEPPGTRASVGGWGLGVGIEDSGKATEEDDEDETLDWDQAQAVVERMVGMQPESSGDTRRRT